MKGRQKILIKIMMKILLEYTLIQNCFEMLLNKFVFCYKCCGYFHTTIFRSVYTCLLEILNFIVNLYAVYGTSRKLYTTML